MSQSVSHPVFAVPAPKTAWQRRALAGSMAKMTRRFRPETGKFEEMVESRKVVGKATASRAFGLATLLSCGTFAAGIVATSIIMDVSSFEEFHTQMRASMAGARDIIGVTRQFKDELPDEWHEQVEIAESSAKKRIYFKNLRN